MKSTIQQGASGDRHAYVVVLTHHVYVVVLTQTIRLLNHLKPHVMLYI